VELYYKDPEGNIVRFSQKLLSPMPHSLLQHHHPETSPSSTDLTFIPKPKPPLPSPRNTPRPLLQYHTHQPSPRAKPLYDLYYCKGNKRQHIEGNTQDNGSLAMHCWSTGTGGRNLGTGQVSVDFTISFF
jgi:hypothetical protein